MLAMVFGDSTGNGDASEHEAYPVCLCFSHRTAAIEWAIEYAAGQNWILVEWSCDSKQVVEEINSVEEPTRWNSFHDILNCSQKLEKNGWHLSFMAR